MLSLPKVLKKIDKDIKDIQYVLGHQGEDGQKAIKNLSVKQILIASVPRVILSWDAPSGVTVTGYTVLYSYDGGGTYTHGAKTNVNEVQLDLPDYGEVYFRVTAETDYMETITTNTHAILRKVSNVQNEIKEIVVGQYATSPLYLIDGVLAYPTPCTIELRADGEDWDDAQAICTFINFPYTFSSYLEEGEHLFRARINTNGVYSKEEVTFKLYTRNERPVGQVIKSIDNVRDPNFQMDSMFHFDDKLINSFSLRYDYIYDDDFDKLWYITFDSTENFDPREPLNMAELSFESIWNDSFDKEQDFDSYFKVMPTAWSRDGFEGPIADIGQCRLIVPEFDFKCNVTKFNNDATLNVLRDAKPRIYLRFSEDGSNWSDWQLYIKTSIRCRYIQFKLVFADVGKTEDIEILSLRQNYKASFNLAEQILNSIHIEY